MERYTITIRDEKGAVRSYYGEWSVDAKAYRMILRRLRKKHPKTNRKKK